MLANCRGAPIRVACLQDRGVRIQAGLQPGNVCVFLYQVPSHTYATSLPNGTTLRSKSAEPSNGSRK